MWYDTHSTIFWNLNLKNVIVLYHLMTSSYKALYIFIFSFLFFIPYKTDNIFNSPNGNFCMMIHHSSFLNGRKWRKFKYWTGQTNTERPTSSLVCNPAIKSGHGQKKQQIPQQIKEKFAEKRQKSKSDNGLERRKTKVSSTRPFGNWKRCWKNTGIRAFKAI